MQRFLRILALIIAGIIMTACTNYYGDAPDLPPEPSVTPIIGQACGARTRYSCQANEYCYFEPNTHCDFADRTGVCQPRPEMCTREYRPVCGCDGKTYPTACVAASSGTSVVHEGVCQ